MTHHTDYLVIGSGIAGLTTARELSKHGTTTLISKSLLRESATEYAQGGIAAALQKDDAPNYHLEDTLKAGDGLCNKDAVKILVEEGPKRVQELMDLGARFDYTDGELNFTQEAAHSKRRILHAGDATGHEIEKTLGQNILKENKVTLIPNTPVIQLLVEDNTCYGCIARHNNTLTEFHAKATVLATGGCGQLYTHTTNPSIATGDGIAIAYNAGAAVQDMEFIQFHPTTLYLGDKKPISLFLISEAVRGEGGLLRNLNGDRFVSELASRDIVARAIFQEMQKTNTNHVYLDLSQLSLDIPKRFPTIYNRCLKAGINITKEPIPVAPAAHYIMGGIQTDLWGQTTIQNLYAGGEVACIGIHGANRLASNSLLDGLVFGHRIAQHITSNKLPSWPARHSLGDGGEGVGGGLQLNTAGEEPGVRDTLRTQLWQHAGILRNKEGLTQLQNFLSTTQTNLTTYPPELQNMITVATLITQSALQRTESRGSHYRTDYPEKNDVAWQRHIVLKKKKNSVTLFSDDHHL